MALRGRNVRARVLRASAQVVRREGPAALTLDAVAREAGVSKGGLLYHFPSKRALVSAMIDDLLARFGQDHARALVADPEPESTGRWLRAYIRASAQVCDVSAEALEALLAGIATDPDLLAPVRAAAAEWQAAAMRDGVDPAVGTVVRLAMDGLWIAELFDLAPPRGALRERAVALLLALASGTGRPPGSLPSVPSSEPLTLPPLDSAGSAGGHTPTCGEHQPVPQADGRRLPGDPGSGARARSTGADEPGFPGRARAGEPGCGAPSAGEVRA